MFKLDLRKAEETDQIAIIRWIIDKRNFRKTYTSTSFYYAKAFDCVDRNKLWNSSTDGNTRPLTCLLTNLCTGQEAIVRTNMVQQAGSKLGEKYLKAVYCHSAYSTYMQSTSCKMLGWMNHKLES